MGNVTRLGNSVDTYRETGVEEKEEYPECLREKFPDFFRKPQETVGKTQLQLG